MATEYFSNFGTFYYPFYDADSGQFVPLVMTDITANLRPTIDMIQGLGTYLPYEIKDGQTPWIVSELYYGSPYYDFLIMIANNIFDYTLDWPMSLSQVNAYVIQKYGAGNQYATHHYTTPDGSLIVDSTYPGALPVDNYTYEMNVNDAKRQIVLIDPVYLPTIKKQMTTLLSN